MCVTESDFLRNTAGEFRKDGAYLLCGKCGDVYLLHEETLNRFKRMVGVPERKKVSQELGTYFVTEDCADERAKITLVEPAFS